MKDMFQFKFTSLVLKFINLLDSFQRIANFCGLLRKAEFQLSVMFFSFAMQKPEILFNRYMIINLSKPHPMSHFIKLII